MLVSLLPTCYCLMIVMKRNSSQARGSAAPPRKLSQRAHCPQSAPASPHRGHCTHIKLKNCVIVKLQTSRTFVSSSSGDTAVKHRYKQPLGNTGPRTEVGAKWSKSSCYLEQRNCEQPPHQERWVHSPGCTFHTSILAPLTGTPSHLHTSHGEQHNYVFIVPWYGIIITVGQQHWCQGATVSYLG